MKRLGFALITAVFLLPASAAASTGLVASATDSGEVPIASAGGWIHSPHHPPKVEVLAWPPARVEVNLDVQCFRGDTKRSYDTDLPTELAPVQRRVRLALRHADDCYISADASYENVETDGRIVVRIYRQMPKPDPEALTFAQARRIIRRAEPKPGIQSCERLTLHLFVCQVVSTLAYEEEHKEGKVVGRRAVREAIWAKVGPRGSEWAFERDELHLPQ